MLEVLMFLFENYMDGGIALDMDDESVVIELEKVGFDRYEVGRALEWLYGLAEVQQEVSAHSPSVHAIRHFLIEEEEHFGVAGLNLLLNLERMGVLDPVTREVVIDRVMALDDEDVTLGRIRWVVLMVLFAQPEKKSALILMQEMVLADASGVLH